MPLTTFENEDMIEGISEEEMHAWHEFISTNPDILYQKVEVSEAMAEKYKFDFHGLLTTVGGVKSSLWYPHLIINGLKASTDYDGQRYVYIVQDKSFEEHKNKMRS